MILGLKYEYLENTHAENNGPFNKNIISITDRNITTVPNNETTNHTAEISLNETITTVYSSRLWKTPISRKDKFYDKNVQL
jgi:hypothetical protein